jgi:FdrA protein
MATLHKTIRNLYRDSVTLMQLSATLGRLPGVRQASAVMATEGNLSLLREAGLLQEELSASPNELLIVVEGDEEALEGALAGAERALTEEKHATGGDGMPARVAPRSIEMARREMPGANLALISTPGDYAAAEARKALQQGLHVMLFSDNVSLEDEIALKRYARERDLLVMGPDCGTAIINGIPLAFANVVLRGDIGLVAAAGTGLQQVTCLIDRWGGGVSQAIGTGGHDLHREVGGITMLQGLEALAADPATRVIVLISKPPAPEVAAQVLARAAEAGKPVVVNFLGADPATVERPGVRAARTLEEAALLAVDLSTGRQVERQHEEAPPSGDAPALPGTQRYVRGLYSGGTFCYEALFLLGALLGPVYSNITSDPAMRLPDPWRSQGHTAIDLGDDLFTQGRPHPMIDHRLRNERILQEARDPGVAVILLDVVLGYGSHPDPAGEMLPAIRHARKIAASDGRDLRLVASVCGTAGDPQGLLEQEHGLREAGVLLAESNAQAARHAARLVSYQGVTS